MQVSGVDVQFALHKNDEAGMKQGQHLQRPMTEQALLGREADRALQQERSQTAKAQTATGRQINSNQDEKQQDGRNAKDRQSSKNKKSDQERISDQAGKHPYKGHHIDLTL